jgi:hypothetical protein
MWTGHLELKAADWELYLRRLYLRADCSYEL